MSDSSASGAVQSRTFATAEELLDFLSPRAAHWCDRQDEWIFRGQSEDWPLKAKALRDGPWFQEHGLSFGSAVPVRERHWLNDSDELVRLFGLELDRAGLAIPPPAPKLFPDRVREFSGEEPLDDALPTLGLAQHHGLPTPWLDWSFHPRSAAYFACADLVWDRKETAPSPGPGKPASYDERVNKEGQLVVWCTRLRVDRLAFKGAEKVDGVWLTVESAPRAGNSRLHAQAGLFTWLHGNAAHATTVDNHIETLFSRLSDAPSDHQGRMPAPVMYKLSLDRPSQAHRLLKFLLDEGVSAANIKPGTDGVVQTMRERAWCEQRRQLAVLGQAFFGG
jgi:FRG domain